MACNGTALLYFYFTPEKTQHFHMTDTWLMVFKEKITVYADNYSKTHKYKTQLLIVE
jgi:hypothetical protein